MSAAGVAQQFENGQRTPGWFFELGTITDRALGLALKIGAMRAIIKAGGQLDPLLAARAAWVFAREHFSEIRAMVEEFERLPPAEQRRALAKLTASGQ